MKAREMEKKEKVARMRYKLEGKEAEEEDRERRGVEGKEDREVRTRHTE